MFKKEKIVAANFKMNFNSPYERKRWIEGFNKSLELDGKKLSEVKFVLCAPDLHLEEFSKSLQDSRVETGGQNCFWESKGAFTGETSPRALYSWGARYVILGHSERKRYFGEDAKMIAQKLQAALKESLIPIVCVGESAQEKEEGKTFEMVSNQLKGYLGELEAIRVRRIIFCYEPIWAISANGPARLPDQNDIMSARLVIQKFLSKTYGPRLAEQAAVIYGGSVDSQNVEEICLRSGMDGALVGSASLKPLELVKIAQMMEEAS